VSYTVSTFLKEAAGQGLTMLAHLAYRLQTDLHAKRTTMTIGRRSPIKTPRKGKKATSLESSTRSLRKSGLRNLPASTFITKVRHQSTIRQDTANIIVYWPNLSSMKQQDQESESPLTSHSMWYFLTVAGQRYWVHVPSRVTTVVTIYSAQNYRRDRRPHSSE
jgi:hypothetical protein